LEDGCGGLDKLHPEKVKDWIPFGGKIHFVFVSACYSNVIGQGFVDAGVPHVVCCRHDCKIRDSAAIQFEKYFYMNLAMKKTLQQAFHMAKQAINESDEADKFCLLPDHRSHDVPVFFRDT
jgi:hypothetical protein